jgi:hypothetical protein
MGSGASMEHPKCTVDGIHALAPYPDGNYMGHRIVGKIIYIAFAT